jgi:hypothetical protein
MKNYQIIFIFLITLLMNNSFAKSRRTFFYSEAIDNFSMIDQISGWSALHNKSYHNSFEKNYKFTTQDKSLIENYIKIRKKYLIRPEVKNHHLFPSKSIHLDTFSRAFFTANTMTEAYLNLKEVVGDKDHQFLTEFYDYFLKRIKPWRQEGQAFHSHLKAFEKKFKKGKGPQTVKKFIKFLNLDKKEFRKLYYTFTWAPEFEPTSVEFMSNILLIKINPIAKMANPNFANIMTEIVDSLLDAQTESQKTSFSTQFNKECNAKKMPASLIFKWPLAVAGGAILFTSNMNKKDFRISKEWSKNPWVQSYSQLIFAQLEKSLKRKDHLMGTFMKESAVTCQNLVNLSDFLSGLK